MYDVGAELSEEVTDVITELDRAMRDPDEDPTAMEPRSLKGAMSTAAWMSVRSAASSRHEEAK